MQRDILTRQLERKLDEKESEIRQLQASLRAEMQNDIQVYKDQIEALRLRMDEIEETLLTLMKEMVNLRLELSRTVEDSGPSSESKTFKKKIEGKPTPKRWFEDKTNVRNDDDAIVVTRRR